MSEKTTISIPEFFFLLRLIMRYCTWEQIFFATSEPKIFSLALKKRKSATSLYYQFLKYQSSHVKKKTFFLKCCFCFYFVSNVIRLSSFVKSSLFTGLSKIIFLLVLKIKHDLMDCYHFLMNQRSLNESNIFLDFTLLLNLILRCYTRVITSFVTSESKKYFL